VTLELITFSPSPREPYATFGQRLQIARKELGMTQREVALGLRIHKSEISGYERDCTKPTFWNLAQLAKMLNVSLDWLCGLTDERRPLKEN
jgi:transcriptional regulator with XRE-family HTH domain